MNINVSCFRDYDTPYNPVNVNLLAWLQSEKHRGKVERIRSLTSKAERDEIKATLPAITPSGTFSYRSGGKLIQHSGLIQFDIDFKENPHISNYTELKKQLCNLSTVAYCGLSVSGTGYWGLIPIAYPDKHKEHFAALEKIFASFGIVLDTKPKNVSSLRGYSFDDDAYFNHHAKTFTKYEKPLEVAPRPVKFAVNTDTDMLLADQEKTELCIGLICESGTDITADYNNWFSIGCSFASTFGNNGEDYFHMASQFYPGYDKQKTEDQYKQCIKATKGQSPSLAVFFALCKDAGINYTESEVYKERLEARKKEKNKQERVGRLPDKTDNTPEAEPPPPEDKPLTEHTFEELVNRFDFEFALAQIPYILYDPECTLLRTYAAFADSHNAQLTQAA